MAYFYVKAGGTASGNDGRYTSKQTGSFAALGSANYYGTLADVSGALNPPSNGDYICISNLHFETYSVGNLTLSSSSAAQPIVMMTVSDSAIDTNVIATALQIQTSTAYDVIFTGGNWSLYGLWFFADDDIIFTSATKGNIIAEHCVFEVGGAGDICCNVTGDGTTCLFRNCEFKAGSGTTPVSIGSGEFVRFEFCKFTLSGYSHLFAGTQGDAGGMTTQFVGCDFTSMDTLGYLVSDLGNSNADDNCYISFDMCTLPNGTLGAALAGFVEEEIAQLGTTIQVTRSAHALDPQAREYQFFVERFGGTAEMVTSEYRHESVAWPSGVKTSIHVYTYRNNWMASPGHPFWFDMPARFVKMSDAAANQLRIFFTCGRINQIRNDEVWVEVYYPDATNPHIWNRVSTKGGSPIDGFGWSTHNGSYIPDNHADSNWLIQLKEYYIEVDIAGIDPGADCVPIIRFFVGCTDLSLWVDPVVEVY